MAPQLSLGTRQGARSRSHSLTQRRCSISAMKEKGQKTSIPHLLVAQLDQLLAKLLGVGEEARGARLGVGGHLLDLLGEVIVLVLQLDGDLQSQICTGDAVKVGLGRYVSPHPPSAPASHKGGTGLN